MHIIPLTIQTQGFQLPKCSFSIFTIRDDSKTKPVAPSSWSNRWQKFMAQKNMWRVFVAACVWWVLIDKCWFNHVQWLFVWLFNVFHPFKPSKLQRVSVFESLPAAGSTIPRPRNVFSLGPGICQSNFETPVVWVSLKIGYPSVPWFMVNFLMNHYRYTGNKLGARPSVWTDPCSSETKNNDSITRYTPIYCEIFVVGICRLYSHDIHIHFKI